VSEADESESDRSGLIGRQGDERAARDVDPDEPFTT